MVLDMAGMRVLVVEDDRDLRDALEHILRIEGFEPICRGDGEAALEYLHESAPPRLILLDIAMPRMDGLRLRDELMKDPGLRKVPVVIVSSFIETPLVGRRLDLPYLTKPFDAGTLLETVRRYAS